MTKDYTVIANWKMNLLREEGISLARAVAAHAEASLDVRTVVCPPSLMLRDVAEAVGNSISVGAQDCHAESHGAYTGDVSAAMARDAGATYVLVGHSERRDNYAESDALVAEKALAASEAGLIPVICVGEQLADRESGAAIDVVTKQVLGSVSEELTAPYLVAYEPVWAIGTGKVPTLDDIEAMHAALRKVLMNERDVESDDAYALYGGSVKASNANDIFACASVGGVLVGGASLNADEFGAIIKAAS